MNISKRYGVLACLMVASALLLGMLASQPANANPPQLEGEFPQPVVEIPTPHQVTPIEEFAQLRDFGLDAVLAYAATLDAETRAALQPEIDALAQPVSTQSTEQVEATMYVGINNGGCAYYSIQDALLDSSQGDAIKVVSGTYADTPDIGNTWLTIRGGYEADCLTHSGGTTTLDGDSTNSVFDINNSTVTLRDFIITDGGGFGAGVDVLGTSEVTLDNTRVYQNNGSIGGGIYVGSSAIVTATNASEINGNTATVYGGGMAVYGQFSAFDNYSDIKLNEAPHGGGIYANGAEVLINAADVYQNQATAADGKGGGIYALGNTHLTTSNSCFIYYQNTAYNGAGIYADHSMVDMTYSTFRDNHASNFGGALYLINGSTFNATGTDIGQWNSTFPNEAVMGAGIFVMTSTVTMNGGSIVGNSAQASGAGAYADASTITLNNVMVGGDQINANVLTDSGTVIGAGIYLSDNSQATLQNTTVSYNQASGSPTYAAGIGIYVDDSTLSATGSRIEKNEAFATAAGRGAGLYISSSNVTLTDCGLYTNSASHAGGAIRVYGPSTLTMENSMIQNNKSTTLEGGGIGAIYSAWGPPRINLVSTTFYSNSAETNGGAIYMELGTIDVDGAWLFDYNKAKENGGAIATNNVTLTVDTDYTVCDPTIAECNVFTTNYADYDSNFTGYGGAIYALDSRIDVNHARFYQNNAAQGGGIYNEGATADLQVRNTLMFDNEVSEPFGAGIRVLNGTVLLRHVTLAENIGGAGYSQAGSDAIVSQSIAWENTSGGFLYTGGTLGGSCNIDQSENVGVYQDPIFVDASSDNFHLQPHSPAVDVCTSGLVLDLDGNARPLGYGYDMGAYERTWDYTTLLPISLRDS